MALINCEECKKEISDKAATCPHCGCPAAHIAESKAAAKKEKTEHIQSQAEPVMIPFHDADNGISLLKLANTSMIQKIYIVNSDINTDITKGKAALGAVVGGVVLGPVGAIAGGLLGAGKKKDGKHIVLVFAKTGERFICQIDNAGWEGSMYKIKQYFGVPGEPFPEPLLPGKKISDIWAEQSSMAGSQNQDTSHETSAMGWFGQILFAMVILGIIIWIFG